MRYGKPNRTGADHPTPPQDLSQFLAALADFLPASHRSSTRAIVSFASPDSSCTRSRLPGSCCGVPCADSPFRCTHRSFIATDIRGERLRSCCVCEGLVPATVPWLDAAGKV